MIRCRVLAQKSPHIQIFQDGQIGKNPPPLGHLADTQGDNLIGRQAVNRLRLEKDLARTGRHNAADGHQGGGFAGAVGADQGDDFPLLRLSRLTPFRAWILP